jgi:DNA/RNA-binding domain of Phe-tRNA-synthetase-like protein
MPLLEETEGTEGTVSVLKPFSPYPPFTRMQIEIAPDVAPLVGPAVLAFDGVHVVDRDARMDASLAETEARLRTAVDLEPVITAVRAMYRSFGIDPTKTRPSSEALLRRVRKGEGLPRINSLVDICNWCSVETQLPFGLYDRGRLAGDAIVLRRGGEGESYEGIRKDRVNVAGRLTLTDALGPFGNPTSDSARTMITTGVTNVLFVIYAPHEAPSAVRARAVDLVCARVAAFAGGRLAWSHGGRD